ncbi:MAG: DUF885 domain-containing protein [Acidobacteriota bacterium]|nr:DUF885 domain-containing protein [Acidobacteriota bacterium]
MGDAAARLTPAAALDRFFEAYYRRRPVTATFTGVHEHDHHLPDWSPDGLDSGVAEMRELRGALDAAGRVPDERVGAFPDEVDLALADAFLEIQIAEHEGPRFYRGNPYLWTGEAIFAIVSLVTRDFAPLVERHQAATARMAAIPVFLTDARRTLSAAPRAWMVKALRECDAAEILFGRSLPAWASQGQLPSHDAFVKACGAALVAFREFRHWLESGLPEAAVGQESAGEAVLSLLLRRGHWCAAPPDALLAEARTALDEAHAALETKLAGAGLASWDAAQARLTAVRPTAEDYLPRFARTWQRCHDAVTAAELVTWPDRPIRYVPIPNHTRDAAPLLYYLFYRSPAAFDRLPVHDYVVTPIDGLPADEVERRLSAANDSTILLNHVVHHGGLGHHVQNAHAYQSRSRIGQVAAIDAASRIAMFSGGTMAEGWACYACDVAEEIGLLSPLDQLAQQHTRVRLAARAVADLALHVGRTTLDEAARFYETRGLMSAPSARAEAVKNAMFPGAAVMYWLGTREIHRLREAVRMREGAAFSLKRFHDTFLGHGAIPVPLIARLMAPEGTPR